MIKYFVLFKNNSYPAGVWVKISETKAQALIAKGRKTVNLYNQNLDFDGIGIY